MGKVSQPDSHESHHFLSFDLYTLMDFVKIPEVRSAHASDLKEGWTVPAMTYHVSVCASRLLFYTETTQLQLTPPILVDKKNHVFDMFSVL